MAYRRTYEQIAKGNQSRKNAREIFGYAVDGDTFRKYNKEYTIGFCLWSLSDVERLATNPEVAKRSPQIAAGARQIMNQIIAEITGKDDKTMNEPKTAAEFIGALREIYTDTRATYTAANDKLEKARKKMERADADTRDPNANTQMAQARYLVAKGEFQLAADEARIGYNAMIDNHNKQVKELRNQLEAFLDEHYAASPDKLDTATMQLLNTDICTPVELARLVDRHQGNPTMLRIVGEYARKLREDNRRNMSPDNQVICTNVANAGFSAKDGSRELAIFDSAVSATNYGLGKDYGHATRMASHMDGWLSGFEESMNNLPLIPEEMAPTGADAE